MVAGVTLLIIGNGFDRQCGLNSSYSHFFEWLSQDKGRANNNLWAVHFLNNQPKGRGWIDIEKSLYEALSRKVGGAAATHHWAQAAVNFYKSLQTRMGASYPKAKESVYIVNHIENKERERHSVITYTGFLMN